MNATRSPIQVPLLLGMIRLHDYPELATPQALLGFIERCVEHGLNAFDHANIYGQATAKRVSATRCGFGRTYARNCS